MRRSVVLHLRLSVCCTLQAMELHTFGCQARAQQLTSRNTSASRLLMLAVLILLMIPLMDFLRACVGRGGGGGRGMEEGRRRG